MLSTITLDISGAIVTIFVPVETGMIALQSTYFMAFKQSNCGTLHVTRVYFLRLRLTIKKCCMLKV